MEKKIKFNGSDYIIPEESMPVHFNSDEKPEEYFCLKARVFKKGNKEFIEWCPVWEKVNGKEV
jgi:hypothetical protein